MEIILFIAVAFYCIYLNLRLKDVNSDNEMYLDLLNGDIQENTNRIVELEKKNKEIKKVKIAKPRRRSTKRRSKIS
jgi:hypothetical protein|tara:strand:- start:108 stop:335 length:228 start_codon:yes stop_codon:yes gene_type:complete